MLRLLLLRCYINNSIQLLEDKTQTGVISISACLVKHLMKKLHNSRTSYGNDVKLGPLSKTDKSDTLTSERFDDNVIVIFSTFVQFGAIQKPKFKRIQGRSKKFRFGGAI